MIRRDITPHTTDMAIAIASWHEQADTPRVVAAVLEAGRGIASLDHEAFARMVHKLLLVGRPEKAMTLVDALGAWEPRPLDLLALRLVWLALR